MGCITVYYFVLLFIVEYQCVLLCIVLYCSCLTLCNIKAIDRNTEQYIVIHTKHINTNQYTVIQEQYRTIQSNTKQYTIIQSNAQTLTDRKKKIYKYTYKHIY